jgi:mannose-6-phosphate isomerase-like protein (cupin superfamily)
MHGRKNKLNAQVAKGTKAMDAHSRLIRRQDMVACKIAFIDCKMPGSTAKENYSLIGPGVTQSADQVVNITEPHGFSLGVAAMPPGTTNNLHVHYTAEVFMVFSGTWLFRWGADGRDGEIVGRAGDVVSIPTWIFRGFSNVGDDDGWIFTALGGDDTGGIIWHPSILKTAAEQGLFLTRDNMLVDTEAGAQRPKPEDLIEPLDDATIHSLRRFDTLAMRNRVVANGERHWSARALLDSVLSGHAAELAPVIGHGMSQDLEQSAPIGNPHGFSLEWLRIAPEQTVGSFRLTEKQVLLVFAGAIAVTMDGGTPVGVETQEVFSVPGGAWRSIASVGAAPAESAVMTAGDHKKHPQWSAEVTAAAASSGIGVDHSGYLAPLRLLPPEAQPHAA